MAIDVLVVIANGKLAELFAEAITTSIVNTTHTPTLTTPVTIAVYVLVQLRIIGIDSTAFAHGYVVRRIERTGTDITDSSCLLPFSINEVF